MQKVVIIGATSAIAEKTARLYATQGAALFLTARNAARLQAVAQDLTLRGATKCESCVLDINDVQQHAAVLQRIWDALGPVDVVLIATGTLPDQAACQESVPKMLQEFNTNGLSVMAFLTPLANRMQAQGNGTIAVISSVAGDRGRQSNYLYGSAKAALTAFLSGLRQRLAASGVNVLTIKPGFVDTPMTRDFKKGPLWASSDAVARGIVGAIGRRRSVVYLPWFWWGIMFIIRHIPETVFRRLKL